MVPDIVPAPAVHDEIAERELVPSELMSVAQVIRTCFNFEF